MDIITINTAVPVKSETKNF